MEGGISLEERGREWMRKEKREKRKEKEKRRNLHFSVREVMGRRGGGEGEGRLVDQITYL